MKMAKIMAKSNSSKMAISIMKKCENNERLSEISVIMKSNGNKLMKAENMKSMAKWRNNISHLKAKAAESK
jgi:hypothetical protein